MAFEYSPHWPHDPKPDLKRCKASVWVAEGRGSSSHQCHSKPKLDGWCNIHHPDAEKARDEKASKRYHEKMEKRLAPSRRLERYRDFIEEIAKEECHRRNTAADPVALDCFEAKRHPCTPCRARDLLKENRT